MSTTQTEPVLERAGRLLARRPYGEKELVDKLLAAGLEPDDVSRGIARLIELKLLDDAEFARWFVEGRARKGLAADAIVAELEHRGIERDVAEEAVTDAGLTDDEEERARALAAAYLPRVSQRPLEVQARRIQAMLLRKGFPFEVAVAGTKAVLPPEGWD